MSRNSTGYTGQLEPRRREFLSLVATLLPQETHDILLQTLNLFQLAIAICGKRIIVNFCRMDPAKNLMLLVDSFCNLHKDYPNYKLELFVIADYDAAIESKEELINYCNSKEAKEYISVLPGEQNILEKIVDYTMFVSSSLHEGLSNSMLEAMAIGLPCVCTDCDGGGAREVITDGENGILVKSNDITALYLGMKKMIDDPQRAEEMGVQAMKIIEKTNIHDVATKWESILEKLN